MDITPESNINLVEKAALSLAEPSRARLARALLAGLAPRDPETLGWYGPAAELVDSYLAQVQGVEPAPPAGVGGEPHDPRLDDDPTLAEIKRRRQEIESGEVSLFEDNVIVNELKRRLGL